MSFENTSFKEGSVRGRLQDQPNTIADMAIGSVFESSDDIRKALTEVLED